MVVGSDVDLVVVDDDWGLSFSSSSSSIEEDVLPDTTRRV